MQAGVGSKVESERSTQTMRRVLEPAWGVWKGLSKGQLP